MVTLFEAMKQKRWVQILSYNDRKNKNENSRGTQSKVIPLKILSSSQTGRQYLVCHVLKQKKLKSFRLDNILEAKMLDVCNEYDIVHRRYKEAEKYRWGASFGNFKEIETIEFILKFRDDEEHIYQCLVREKRCGTAERLSKNEARYSAEVWDAHEMLPWVRTFIMRITELHISNKELEEHFWNDVREMKNNYKEMLYDF